MKEPIIAIEQGNIYAFPTKKEAEVGLEPIDIENEEYEIFDSEGLELAAKVSNHWTPITLKDSDPNTYKVEYLKSMLVNFLERRGDSPEKWINQTIDNIVKEIIDKYPTK